MLRASIAVIGIIAIKAILVLSLEYLHHHMMAHIALDIMAARHIHIATDTAVGTMECAGASNIIGLDMAGIALVGKLFKISSYKSII
jgi:hypothetical protein